MQSFFFVPSLSRRQVRLGLVAVAAALSALGGGPVADADAAEAGAAVRPGPASGAMPKPLPVRPAGLTNASKKAKAIDRTNSTSASGDSRLPEPPSAGHPPPGGRPAGTANDPASAPAQSVSSQSKGTNPPADDGSLPTGTTGSTNRGGGPGAPR